MLIGKHKGIVGELPFSFVVVCGCVRLCVVVCGCVLLCIVVCGCARLCVVLCGCVRVCGSCVAVGVRATARVHSMVCV